MGINRAVYKLAEKLGGVEFEVYDKNGVFLGKESTFVNAIKRSANENIAEFGREGLFHYRTKLEPGCLIWNRANDEKYIISAMRSQDFKKQLIYYSVYLLQVNAEATVKRNTLSVANITTANFDYSEVLRYSDIPAFLRKEDWTMESMTPIGREQRGYETLVIQNSYDVAKGDLVYTFDNKYIVQYITKYSKEGYLEIQLGIDVK